ncbi:FMN-binding protein [Actinokineospora inagensis]|uniref:FMN-binding protein n=1 Tax=Actinokineospora inagensis TaxID=103730 RepID=UPI0004052C7E|nr:FMN-binding protein [Actinokineospora inagensis]
MKRIVFWLLSTATVVVLLFGYHTSTSGAMTAESSAIAPANGTAGTTGTAGSGSSSGSTGTTASGKTYTGPVADTRWGNVQVQITVADGKVTAVSVPQQPNGNGRDREINARAVPILVQETLSAQSSDIDMVSGATVTSDGYVQSLQGALDEAGL